MHDLANVTLDSDDFAALAQMCGFDMHFPASYDEWSILIKAAEHRAQEMALQSEPVVLEPPLFERWCARLEIAPSVDALRAYVIVRRRQAGESLS